MTDRDAHAPAAVRVLVVGGLLVGGLSAAAVALVVLGASAGAAAGAVVAIVLALATLTLAARAWGVSLVLEGDELVVRNPIRRTRFGAGEVAELRADRYAGRLGKPGSQVAVVGGDGRSVRSVASLAAPFSGHERAELFLALRRWSAAHEVTDGLPHREYGDDRTRRLLLEGDEEVEVQAWVRRTDSRGWGGWEPGTLSLPDLPAGRSARWTPDVPTRSAPAVTGGGAKRGRTVQLRDAEKVVVRPARFTEEQFFGPGTSFIVITTLRRTVEVALRPDEAEPALARLRAIDSIPAPTKEQAG